MSAADERGELRLEVARLSTRLSILRSTHEDLWLELRPRLASGRNEPRLALLSDGAGAERRTAHRAESWWIRPDGFEQTFRIERRDAAGDGPLRVEMDLVTPLMRQVQERGQTVLFLRRGVPVLRVSKLFAFDARNRALPAHFELGPGRLDIVVEDAGAVYPVTIDPLFGHARRVAHGIIDGESFGFSVAGGADVNGDGFDDALFGAPTWGTPGSQNEGRAALHLGGGLGISASGVWSTTGGQEGARYGHSVALAGDVNADGYTDVLVGAPHYDGGQLDEGRAVLFLGSSKGPGASPAWAVEGNEPGAHFGVSVAGAGDVNGDGYADVLVGADSAGGGGSASLFLGSASGLSLPAAWVAQGGQAGASFGACVASAGDVNGDGFADIVVGAPGWDGAFLDEGRGSLFVGSPTGLSTAMVWTALGGQSGASFGTSIAAAGDVNGDGFDDVIVGSPGWDGGASFDNGRAQVFLGEASGLESSPSWSTTQAWSGAQLGQSVAGAGDIGNDGFSDVALVGPGGGSDSDIVLVFEGSAGGLTSTPVLESYDANAAVVASAGRSDGHLWNDLLLGDPEANVFVDGDWRNVGAVFVHRGVPPNSEFFLDCVNGANSASGWSALEAWKTLAHAADQIGNESAVLNVLPGTCPSEGPLQLGENLTVIGSGAGVSIIESHAEVIGTCPHPQECDRLVSFFDLTIGGLVLSDGDYDVGPPALLQRVTVTDSINAHEEYLTIEDSTIGALFNSSNSYDYRSIVRRSVIQGVFENGVGHGHGRIQDSQLFGVTAANLGELTIERCVFEGAGGVAVLVNTSYGVQADISSSVFRGYATAVEGRFGADIGNPSVRLANNTFGPGMQGLRTFQGDIEITVVGNLFVDPVSPVLDISNFFSGSIEYNDFHGSPGDIACIEGQCYPTVASLNAAPGAEFNLSVPPGLVNEAVGDYHLRADSPLIDAGQPQSGNGPLQDFDGEVRPYDGDGDGIPRFDIGAYEFIDDDLDGTTDPIDNCRGIGNPDQANQDGDARGDACDNCDLVSNDDQFDDDADGVGTACDVCPAVPDPAQLDADADGHGAACDCADFDPLRHPGATETCNALDDDCDGVADEGIAAPSGSPSLTLSRVAIGARLQWPPLSDATAYDVVRGSLAFLRGSAGDFSTSTSVCLANDMSATAVVDTDTPSPGSGFWHLVRPINCGGLGSFDTGADSQVQPRDMEIASSPNACP